MSYSGSCHCGAVAFTVAGESPAEAISCNCSHCRRKGFLLSFVPAESVTVEQGEDALRPYLFNKHAIEHLFCETCGTEPFARGQQPDGGAICAVNLRCVPSIDLKTLEIKEVDGASF